MISSCGLSSYLSADQIRVAVASNFTNTIKALVQSFEEQSKHEVSLSFGATGRHYAQIKNGAPFDVFFAADSKRPKLLEKEGLIIAGSRMTYALGKLVLWSPKKELVDKKMKVLEQGDFYHIAIANPKLAPYGRAAEEVLTTHKLWNKLRPKIVRGENIAQAFQYVRSGNAELGFVALSQVKYFDKDGQGSLDVIPESLYSPINQQLVLLSNKPAVREFYNFIQSTEAKSLIKSFGYEIAESTNNGNNYNEPLNDQ